MTERYTIKELAITKGVTMPVRAALLALEARVLELEDCLQEQVDQCFDPTCDMCARHEDILKKGKS